MVVKSRSIKLSTNTEIVIAAYQPANTPVTFMSQCEFVGLKTFINKTTQYYSFIYRIR